MEKVYEKGAYARDINQNDKQYILCGPLSCEVEGKIESLMPEHPFIQGDLPRDTLERVAQMLELLQYLDTSQGLDNKAQLGLFRLHQTLAESVEYVSESLKDQSGDQ